METDRPEGLTTENKQKPTNSQKSSGMEQRIRFERRGKRKRKKENEMKGLRHRPP
jgi:hypothetical protein